MHQETKRIRLSIKASTVILLLAAALVSATDPADDAASEDAKIREQSIYSPYSKLREVFERDPKLIGMLTSTLSKGKLFAEYEEKLYPGKKLLWVLMFF